MSHLKTEILPKNPFDNVPVNSSIENTTENHINNFTENPVENSSKIL